MRRERFALYLSGDRWKTRSFLCLIRSTVHSLNSERPSTMKRSIACRRRDDRVHHSLRGLCSEKSFQLCSMPQAFRKYARRSTETIAALVRFRFDVSYGRLAMDKPHLQPKNPSNQNAERLLEARQHHQNLWLVARDMFHRVMWLAAIGLGFLNFCRRRTSMKSLMQNEKNNPIFKKIFQFFFCKIKSIIYLCSDLTEYMTADMCF